MRKIIISDTETTGLMNSDEVIQFSGIILDENFDTETAVNFYSETQVPISAQAFNIHHLSKAKLHVLSDGKFFEDNWMQLIDQLRQYQIVWVFWNRGGFDERLINQTLINNGLDDYFHFPKFTRLDDCYEHRISVFDMMSALCHKLGRSSMKLKDAVNTLPYSQKQINNIYETVASSVPNLDSEQKYHNALYDAFITFLAFKYYFT